jgi:phage tail-like protein
MRNPENRFILLDSVIGWKTLKTEKLHPDQEGLSLQRVPGQGKPLIGEEGSFGGLDYPTGLAVDKKRNIYITDTENHTIRKYDFCEKRFATLDCLGGEGGMARQLRGPRGLAISEDNDLLVADTGNHRIQIFSLKGLALRAIWGAVDQYGKPAKGSGEGQFNQPADVAIDSQGNVYVADKGNKRIQKFTKEGKFILMFGEEEEGEAKLSEPSHIAIDKENRLYVIDEDKDYVPVFDSSGKYLTKIEAPAEVAGPFRPLAIAIDKEGNVYLGEGSGKRVYSFFYQGEIREGASFAGHSIGFKGETSYLMVDDEGTLFASLRDLNMVTCFVPEETRFETEGFFITKPLDSQIYKCQWHKILMEADLPVGTSVQVQTYASESERDIAEIDDPTQPLWSKPYTSAKDFLIQNPPGRFLWLKVTIKGNTTATPLLKNLRIYYPRVSYLQYLPKVYQEDEASRSFLERFLSIFETVLSGYEETINHIHRLFNPLSTPREWLSWLAAWLGMVLDSNWPEDKKRELIKRAPELYKKRGTLEGLKEYIEIYTGLKSHLHIIESYRLRQWIFLGKSTLGQNRAVWGKGIVGRLQLGEYSTICNFKLISTKDPLRDPFHKYAHRFSVIVPSFFCEGETRERAIRGIVEVEKPAHTAYSICGVQPKLRVGVQSTIGVDTIIGMYPVTVLCWGSTLGIDSVLGESPEERMKPTFRIGRKSRIGVDASIN